jgi:osmoprotectant transport system substrate-binding protein
MFARTHRATLIALAGVTTLAFALTACGGKGSSGTAAPPTAAASGGAGCAPAASDTLVLLTDDKHLQSSDNIVAVVNKKASTPELLAAVDKVAAALDQPKLLALNKAVDVDRKTPQQAAKDFADANGLSSGAAAPGGKAVVVGAAGFGESQTLAELYKIALNAAGFKASVKQSTNREVYEPALEKGQITVFPEYAATLTEFLNQKANGKDAKAVSSGDISATVTALKPLADKAGLAVGTPSSASDQNAFAVTKPVADQYGLKTLSDFAAKCSGPASKLAGPPECPQRPFCQPGLQSTYNITFGEFVQADAGGPQTKTALKNGTATLGLVFSSDSSLTAAG